MQNTCSTRTRSTALLAGLVACLCLLAGPVAAQPDEAAVFQGRERVTAIDLILEFEPKRGHEWLYDRQIPKDLAPEDFKILFDGEPRTIISLEEVTDFEVWYGEPWEIVLYFDTILTTTRGVRRMASALGERLESLTAFGSVELVTAGTLPRTRVAATREVGELRRKLSEMALVAEGRDELLTMRFQLLDELKTLADGGESPIAPAELIRRVAEEEARIVGRRHDALLTYLTASATANVPDAPKTAPKTARRAVFLVSDGFDLAPETFYAGLLATLEDEDDAALANDGLEMPDLGSAVGLRPATEELARTLAAYGWVTFGLTLPPPPGPPPGVRVGKWLFTPAKPERMGPDPRYHIVDPGDRHTERRDLKNFWTFIGGIRGRYQERRNPERAEAYLELGRALSGQGKTEEAEDAFRRSIYHFAEDKKYAPRQAEVAAELGQLLAGQGEQEARHVLAAAYQLDPEVATARLGPSAGFADATAPLALLAQETAGWVIQDGDELDQAIATLGHRVRVTYQVSGPADGELHAVTVGFERDGFDLHSPGWARSATPETVASARARQLLREPYRVVENLRGDLFLDARLEDQGAALAVRLESPKTWSEGAGVVDRLRVTLGFGGPDASVALVEHRLFRRQRTEESDSAHRRPWSQRLEIAWPEMGDRDFLAVLVEDLDSGSWGARLIDLGVE